MTEEVGKRPVSLPSLVKAREEFNTLFEQSLRAKLSDILSDISERYGISQSELSALYLVKETRNGLKQIADLCQAKVANGKQCSRRHLPDKQYCGSHINAQPFGTITTPTTPITTEPVTPQVKQRITLKKKVPD